MRRSIVDSAPVANESYVVVAFVGDDLGGWLPTMQSAAKLSLVEPLRVAGDVVFDPHSLITVDIQVSQLSDLLFRIAEARKVEWIVVIGEPSIVPRQLLESLPTFDDQRFATVSFLCNSSGPLSFPHPGVPVPWALDGGTADSITERLHAFAGGPRPVPVPVAAGPAVAFNADVVRMLPVDWDRGATSFAEATMAFSLAAQARGFINTLDTTTYVHRAADLRQLEDLSVDAMERLSRRYPWVSSAIAVSTTDESSPMRMEIAVARAKISGLDVLLDGSCIGPTEMGTQVGLLAIACALARRADVARVAITLPGELPPYAQHLLHEPKVSFISWRIGTDIVVDRHFDIAFRPFQPDHNFDPAILARKARRVIVSLLDLIAFQNGSYFGSGEEWLDYRSSILNSLRDVDAITTISHDVIKILELERLPIASERVFPVVYGTEHLQPTEANRMPAELDRISDARLIVTLGTNYGHKNRDIAVRTLLELRGRGHDVTLVLVGPSVPHGSSRDAEAVAVVGSNADHVISLAGVPAAERNWLLAHAEVLLYPTSAEGFGLVPYEAAWLGTPTVFVPFGPLAEIAGDLPVEASNWSPSTFADQIERLLEDPMLGQQQVERLREASARNPWASTAASLCDVFRAVMAKPPNRQGGVL